MSFQDGTEPDKIPDVTQVTKTSLAEDLKKSLVIHWDGTDNMADTVADTIKSKHEENTKEKLIAELSKEDSTIGTGRRLSLVRPRVDPLEELCGAPVNYAASESDVSIVTLSDMEEYDDFSDMKPQIWQWLSKA